MGRCVCPTCGQAMPAARVPVHGLLDVRFGRRKDRLIAALVDAYPRAVTRERLIDDLYGDEPDGGPDAADRAIYALLSQLRKSLAPLGWTIPRGHLTDACGKYRRLAPLEP